MVATRNAYVTATHGGNCCATDETAVRCMANAHKRVGHASSNGHGLGCGHNRSGHGSGSCRNRDGDFSWMFCQSDDPHQHINGLPSQLAINYDPTKLMVTVSPVYLIPQRSHCVN